MSHWDAIDRVSRGRKGLCWSSRAIDQMTLGVVWASEVLVRGVKETWVGET